MDHETKLIEFLSEYRDYRKQQTKLLVLRKKKPDPKNVKPVEKLLKNINAKLTKMDGMAAGTLKQMQEEGSEVKQSVISSILRDEKKVEVVS